MILQTTLSITTKFLFVCFIISLYQNKSSDQHLKHQQTQFTVLLIVANVCPFKHKYTLKNKTQ